MPACSPEPPSVSIPAVDSLLGTCDLDTLRLRQSWKWRTYPADVLPAFVAEMDYDIAAPVRDAVSGALAISDTGYPHAGVVGEAYASFAAARFGWAPSPGWVVPVPDVMTGLAEVVVALTPPGSGIVITPPVYPPFWFRFGFYGRQMIEAPLARDADGRYDLDFAAIEAALRRPDAATFLLCSPHNPTGNVWSAGQLRTVADLCQRHGVLLAVDEIHAPLALAGASFVPFGSIDHEMTQRAYTFTSASKGWNIPGLKCGLAVVGSDAAAALLAERAEALLAGHLGVLATVAAFTKALPWLDAARSQLDANRHLLTSLLAEHLPGVRYAPPQASFLAWLDCRGLGLGDDPAAAFLERGKVALTPGPGFGPQGAGFARLNMGTSPELLAEAVRRMAQSLGRAG